MTTVTLRRPPVVSSESAGLCRLLSQSLAALLPDSRTPWGPAPRADALTGDGPPSLPTRRQRRPSRIPSRASPIPEDRVVDDWDARAEPETSRRPQARTPGGKQALGLR